jgi:hypothetical protein
VVESSALLKRRSPKGYRGFESLPHRFPREKLQALRLNNIFAYSPYAKGKIVNVSVFTHGEVAICPYTGRKFLAP